MRLVAALARAAAHIFYRVDTVGRVPPDGPLILVANHPNALLDPALVIATAGRPVRFLAKSTLFKGRFGPLVRGAGAIPVFRKQDPGVDVMRNTDTFAAVDAALGRGEAVCIFPEGVSHSTGKLEQLRTGAARMALSAASKGIEVRLVPVGINPERKTVFRSRLTVFYGVPFSVTTGSHVHRVTDEIAGRMRNLIVEADPEADAQLVARIDALYSAARAPAADAQSAIERRRVIASGLERLRREHPQRYQAALLQLRRYHDRLTRFGIGDHALDWGASTAEAWRFVIRELPLALLLTPVAAVAAIAFAVPYLLTAAVGRRQRHSDVTATAKVIAGFVLYPVWIVLLAGLAGARYGPGAGLGMAVLLPVVAVAGLFAIERETSALVIARSWLALRDRHPDTRQRLRRDRSDLAEVLDDVHEWLSSEEISPRT